MYTDPSGEFIWFAVAAVAISLVMKAVSNMNNGVPFWYGMGKTAAISIASSAISFGIGSAFGGVGSLVKEVVRAGFHGMASGLMSKLDGGDFTTGFLSGAVSSLIGSGIGAIGNSGVGELGKIGSLSTRNPILFKAITITSGALSGGFSSAIAGGKFIDGFKQGLIVSGLNHASHDVIMELKGGGKTTLADYKDDINKRLDGRISELNEEQNSITEKINKAISKGNNARADTLKEKRLHVIRQKSILVTHKNRINNLLEANHPYEIKLSNSMKISDRNVNREGSVMWGENNCQLILVHDGNIDIIIHEAVHLEQIILRESEYSILPFKANEVVSISKSAEYSAWGVSYSLGTTDGITSLDDVIRYVDENY